MRLGTETGSIINWLDSRAVLGEPKPCVGMGATKMSTTKPKRPRKSIIGDKFEAIGEKDNVFFEHIFWVDGPGLDLVACASKADAEMIAAALNMAARATSLKRKAKDLAYNLEAISELFED